MIESPVPSGPSNQHQTVFHYRVVGRCGRFNSMQIIR